MTTAKKIATAGICAALMLGVQVAMSSLPNIEAVSLLIIVFTKRFGRLTAASILVFALLEGFIYGFGMWFIAYLYAWYPLYLAVRLIDSENVIVLTVISGFFGLLFGTLTSFPYFFTLGIGGGISYIVSGLGFDLLHAAGNIVLTLVLSKPLLTVTKHIGRHDTDN